MGSKEDFWLSAEVVTGDSRTLTAFQSSVAGYLHRVEDADKMWLRSQGVEPRRRNQQGGKKAHRIAVNTKQNAKDPLRLSLDTDAPVPQYEPAAGFV